MPLENSAPLFAYSPEERPCHYLFNSPSLHSSLFPSMHLPIQPVSQPGYEHIAGPEGSTVDNLRCVHMAEQRASEEDWHAETKQVYDSEA